MKKERIQYSFDVWLFIPDEDKLIMDNEDVIIDNRLSKLLDFFCQNPKIVFSRDELINEVWNGSILTDQVITQAIFELRKTLKSAERHSMGYIITVPKRGYKFDVEVQKTVLVPPPIVTNTVPLADTVSYDEAASQEHEVSPVRSPTFEPEAANQTQAKQPHHDGSASTKQSDKTVSHEQTAHEQAAEITPEVTPNRSSDNDRLKQQPAPKSGDNYAAYSSTNPSEKNGNRSSRLGFAIGAVVIGAIGIALGVSWWGSPSSTDASNGVSVNNMTELFDSESQSTEIVGKSNQATNHQVIEDHKAHASVHYLSLEPRYIYVRIDESLKNDAFKRGIVHKLMSYLTTYRDFRLIVDETLVPNSANVVSFKSKVDGDREYLDITYFNRISNFKHLGRDYLIDAASLHSTMRTMLDDLLDSFNIDIQKSILKQQISELPKQEEPLQLALESLGLTFMTLDRTDTLKKIIAANELEPDNHFVMSSRYLYELADIFLLKSSQKEKLVQKLNDRFGKKLLLAENNPTSYRIYDALAAYSLTQDNPNAAERYMTLIPRSEYNVMSMIILAKLEESKGNPAAAEEYYYETILESGYPVVLKVAQTLFFNSNISEIESKVEIVK
ncbi:winged helix-turn-helix domain-containing protein [Vibrio sp. Makdt]|uniref:winged helix-turn-helix domain-containing protein n=1 Tax=Vibrio sp. Makdt TaxID=2998828 RepID=UPI0022CD3D47|nr:winged helix-turn-helix domain-containing protein [Vibrio sp. Makdt]MDA0154346.1 winged helix-turn-helix domain-containing protein [Vibrio sp. Makdt]